MLEQGGADDAYATVLQGAAHIRLTESLRAHIALGYYTYSDATPDGSTVILLRDNAGNKAIARNLDGKLDDFVSDFGILNPIIALTYDGWKYPLTFSAEYIKNIRAKNEENKGWAVGAALGKTKVRGDWLAYYQWQVVEQDAVLSPVSQDAFLFGTNHRIHHFGGKYQPSDRHQLPLWGLVSPPQSTFHFSPGASAPRQCPPTLESLGDGPHTLQGLEHRNAWAQFTGHLTHGLQPRRVVLTRPVGEVEAHRVHAGA